METLARGYTGAAALKAYGNAAASCKIINGVVRTMDVGGKEQHRSVFQDFFTRDNGVACIERLPVSISSIDQDVFLFFCTACAVSTEPGPRYLPHWSQSKHTPVYSHFSSSGSSLTFRF